MNRWKMKIMWLSSPSLFLLAFVTLLSRNRGVAVVATELEFVLDVAQPQESNTDPQFARNLSRTKKSLLQERLKVRRVERHQESRNVLATDDGKLADSVDERSTRLKGRSRRRASSSNSMTMSYFRDLVEEKSSHEQVEPITLSSTATRESGASDDSEGSDPSLSSGSMEVEENDPNIILDEEEENDPEPDTGENLVNLIMTKPAINRVRMRMGMMRNMMNQNNMMSNVMNNMMMNNAMMNTAMMGNQMRNGMMNQGKGQRCGPVIVDNFFLGYTVPCLTRRATAVELNMLRQATKNFFLDYFRNPANRIPGQKVAAIKIRMLSTNFNLQSTGSNYNIFYRATFEYRTCSAVPNSQRLVNIMRHADYECYVNDYLRKLTGSEFQCTSSVDFCGPSVDVPVTVELAYVIPGLTEVTEQQLELLNSNTQSFFEDYFVELYGEPGNVCGLTDVLLSIETFVFQTGAGGQEQQGDTLSVRFTVALSFEQGFTRNPQEILTDMVGVDLEVRLPLFAEVILR